MQFESGLSYCRRHAEAVRRNRKWLPDFFQAWLERRPQKKNSTDGASDAPASPGTAKSKE